MINEQQHRPITQKPKPQMPTSHPIKRRNIGESQDYHGQVLPMSVLRKTMQKSLVVSFHFHLPIAKMEIHWQNYE